MKEERLSDGASRLLERARNVPALDVERRVRMKRAVLANAAAALPGGDDPGAAPAGPAHTVNAWRLGLLSAVMVSAAATAVALSWPRSEVSGDVHGPSTNTSAPPTVIDSPVPAVAPDELPAPGSSAPPAEAVVPTVPSPHALGSAREGKSERRRTTTVPSPALSAAVDVPELASSEARQAPIEPPSSQPPPTAPGESSTSSLREELRLVRSADEALGAGDAKRAMELLGEHERRFPRGTLASERSMLGILALCAAGRAAEAREQADRFAERHPRSPLLERLRHSCVGGGKP